MYTDAFRLSHMVWLASQCIAYSGRYRGSFRHPSTATPLHRPL